MKGRKTFVAEDVIAAPVAQLREAAHVLTNDTMQTILARWTEIEFQGGLRNSTKVRDEVYKIVLANMVDNYARVGAAK